MANKIKNSKRAIDHLLTNVPIVTADQQIGKVVELIRGKKDWDTVNYIYVTDEHKNLVGVVSIKELLRAKNTLPIKQIMFKNPIGISASADQYRAAIVAIQNNIKMMPVFKTGTREFLGVVGSDTILQILHKKHTEEFLRFSGIVKDRLAADILKANAFLLVKMRLPWLFLGLAGGVIAAKVVGFFETALQEHLILAMFIPVIVYMSDAVGTQTETLLIRGVAVDNKMSLTKYFFREIAVGIMLAAVCAVGLGLVTYWWWQTTLFALILGTSMFLTIIAAVLIGVLIPIFLFKIHNDPAVGSGPFATVITDITSLIIYFSIATLLLQLI